MPAQMSAQTLLTMIKRGDTTELIHDGMRDLPENEWTENIIMWIINALPSLDRYNVLFDCIPEHCKTYKICEVVSSICPKMLKRVPSTIATQAFYEDVVKRIFMAICEIPRQYRTTKLCEKVIYGGHLGQDMLQYVPHESQTEKLILAAIAASGMGHVLKSAAFQTRNICIEAVKMTPTSIRWVDHQSFEICELALRLSARCVETTRAVIVSIRHHTLEVCKTFLEYMPNEFSYLRNHSRGVCLYAIQKSFVLNVPMILADIQEQNLTICVAAYKRRRDSYLSIRDNVMCSNLVRLILATEALIPLHDVGLSTSLLTEVCERLMPDKFPPALTRNPQLLTPVQMWALAAKVKHAV
ncbi:MAG: hypothetical protein WC052_04450 [Patescibacteria group bacterium]